MKIIYRQGNLLAATERYIAHGCNSHGRMRSGVAKAIREAYPAAFDVYHGIYTRTGLTVGQIVPVDCGTHVVINCITQKDSSTDRELGELYLDYDGLAECIRAIERYLDSAVPVPIAFPKIGAGEAGGNWELIVPILEESAIVQPVVYIYAPEVAKHA